MKKTNIITIILAILVIGLTGYIVYDKVLSTKSANNLNNNEDSDLSKWVNYLSQYDLTLTRSVWNSDKDECNFEKATIASSDVKKIIVELSSKEITKNYYGNNPPAGTICSDRYKLEYNNTNISLESDGVMWVTDQNLINKLDLDVDNFVGASNGGEFVYLFDVDFAEIIEKHINN